MLAFPDRIETNRLTAARCDAPVELDAFAPRFADKAVVGHNGLSDSIVARRTASEASHRPYRIAVS